MVYNVKHTYKIHVCGEPSANLTEWANFQDVLFHAEALAKEYDCPVKIYKFTETLYHTVVRPKKS